MRIVQLSASDVPTIRDLVLEEQGGICPICGRIPTHPVLDHSHTKKLKGTGLVRGVLCSTCNSFLAKIENNSTRYRIKLKDLPTVLRMAAKYLEQDHYPYRHHTEKP